MDSVSFFIQEDLNANTTLALSSSTSQKTGLLTFPKKFTPLGQIKSKFRAPPNLSPTHHMAPPVLCTPEAYRTSHVPAVGPHSNREGYLPYAAPKSGDVIDDQVG